MFTLSGEKFMQSPKASCYYHRKYCTYIYLFEPEPEAWLLMTQRLNSPKHKPVAFSVAPEEFPKCN